MSLWMNRWTGRWMDKWMNEWSNLYRTHETQGSSPEVYSPAATLVLFVQCWQSDKDDCNSTSHAMRIFAYFSASNHWWFVLLLAACPHGPYSSHNCMMQVRWSYVMPVHVLFVSSTSGIISDPSDGAIPDHSQSVNGNRQNFTYSQGLVHFCVCVCLCVTFVCICRILAEINNVKKLHL